LTAWLGLVGLLIDCAPTANESKDEPQHCAARQKYRKGRPTRRQLREHFTETRAELTRAHSYGSDDTKKRNPCSRSQVRTHLCTARPTN
jgi:hypothetical protein